MSRTPHPCVLSVAFVVTGLALVLPEAGAAILRVDRFDDSSTATSCSSQVWWDCSLRGAIIHANGTPEEDEIWLQTSGTYALTLAGSGAEGGDLDITSDIVITGLGPWETTVDASGISGAGDGVLEVHPGAIVTISNVGLRGGKFPGGGVLNRGTLYLESTVVRFNHGNWGGGVYNLGWLEMDRSWAVSNTATLAGGVFNDGTLLMRDSRISHNQALDGYGGGLVNAVSVTAQLERSSIYSNEARGAQGDGGGIQNFGWVNAINCSLWDNTAEGGHGGAIANAADLDLTNVTLWDNSGYPYGSEIYHPAGGTVDLVNTLIVGSCWGDVSGVTSHGGNLEISETCGLDQASDQVNVMNPGIGYVVWAGGFVPTVSLWPGGAAIDAGVSAFCPATDQRNWPRPHDGGSGSGARCDVGAFEFNPAEVWINGFEDGSSVHWSAAVP